MIRVLLLGFAFGVAWRVFGGEYSGQLTDISTKLDDLATINASVQQVRNGLSVVSGDLNDIETELSTINSDTWVPTRNAVQSAAEVLGSAFGPAVPTSNAGYGWFKQFLLGNNSDPWYTQYPQFRTLTETANYNWPSEDANQQSLTSFLSFTLGQFFDRGPERLPIGATWDTVFTTNAVIYHQASGGGRPASGLSSFTIWLAEAQRRLLTNQVDFAALGRDPWTNGLSQAESVAGSEEGNRMAAADTAEQTNKVEAVVDDMQRPQGVHWWSGQLVDSPDWQLDGVNIDPVIFDGYFGGSSTRSRHHMQLKVEFSRMGGTCRAVTSFLVAVGAAVCLIGIVRSEVDYWTTLGGAVT